MNLHIQFQMEDIIRKREEANKKKSSSTTLIVIGSILLSICLVLILLDLLSVFGSDSRTLSETSGVIGCCLTIAALLGVVGLILLIFGISRRSNANAELRSVEDANRLLRTQMIAAEGNKQTNNTGNS